MEDDEEEKICSISVCRSYLMHVLGLKSGSMLMCVLDRWAPGNRHTKGPGTSPIEDRAPTL